MNTTKKQPVKSYYALAAVLMAIGLSKFPWGQGAAAEPMTMALSIAMIALAVGCGLRGLRNAKEAQ
jgi:hypothetical protein